MATLGLSLIIFGWAIQYLSKGKNINPTFVVIYVAGVALLTLDGIFTNQPSMALLNLASLVTALAVFSRIKK